MLTVRRTPGILPPQKGDSFKAPETDEGARGGCARRADGEGSCRLCQVNLRDTSGAQHLGDGGEREAPSLHLAQVSFALSIMQWLSSAFSFSLSFFLPFSPPLPPPEYKKKKAKTPNFVHRQSHGLCLFQIYVSSVAALSVKEREEERKRESFACRKEGDDTDVCAAYVLSHSHTPQ